MIRRAFKRDRNHAEIVEAFKRLGWEVVDFAAFGFHVDLYVLRGMQDEWVEIKDGQKAPSARKLTPACVEFGKLLERHGKKVHVVAAVNDVLVQFGGFRDRAGAE